MSICIVLLRMEDVHIECMCVHMYEYVCMYVCKDKINK